VKKNHTFSKSFGLMPFINHGNFFLSGWLQLYKISTDIKMDII